MASDNFNRANESPLASPYNHVGAPSDLVSNQVTQGGGGFTYRTGAANAFSQIVYISGDFAGPAVHVDSSGNGYFFHTDGPEYIISRSDGGGLTPLVTAIGSFTNGDVLAIRRVGNTLVASIDGVDVLTSPSDTTYTSGEDGWGSFDSLTMDDWTNESGGGGGSIAHILAGYQQMIRNA